VVAVEDCGFGGFDGGCGGGGVRGGHVGVVGVVVAVAVVVHNESISDMCVCPSWKHRSARRDELFSKPSVKWLELSPPPPPPPNPCLPDQTTGDNKSWLSLRWPQAEAATNEYSPLRAPHHGI
jgi:hypothetical protein